MPQCEYKSGTAGMDSLYTKIFIYFPETYLAHLGGILHSSYVFVAFYF